MSSLIREMIEFPSNGHTTPGYVARPDDKETHPGVVVIQEWWGLTPHIKEVAERFAGAGFVALAPDLYHGKVAQEPDEARKLRMAMDRDRAVTEIVASARRLQGMAEVAPKKIGLVGWCLGGGLSLSAAAASAGEIGAAVAFYGQPLSAADTPRLQVPILGLYGQKDAGIPVETVRAFAHELQAHDIPYEIHIYEGAQHAFFNDTRPQVYDAEAAQDAWEKTLAWFQHYLV